MHVIRKGTTPATFELMVAFFVGNFNLQIIINSVVTYHKVIETNLMSELILDSKMVFASRLIVAKCSCDSEVLRASIKDNSGCLARWRSHV